MSPGSPLAMPMRPADGGVAVVIPCYRVTRHILGVIAAVPPQVSLIVCVDDACPDNSGRHIEDGNHDPRVVVLRHETNQGVGGATITGCRAALARGARIIVKVDGDGQMDPRLIPAFVTPIADGLADYTKGNRFYRPENLAGMPWKRVAGNAALSFLSKLSSGYWNIFDPTNGYTAIHAEVLGLVPLDKLSERYFFESDMLFRLSTVRAVVLDIPMEAVYGTERSNLVINKILLLFLVGHMRNFIKRIAYSYFLRDFQIASIEWLLAPLLLGFGLVFGLEKWFTSIASGETASAGTVMLSALPIIVGLQLLLSAINFDVQSVPRRAIHLDLQRYPATNSLSPARADTPASPADPAPSLSSAPSPRRQRETKGRDA
jgi:dolichol-phosphate mannosyltransferase